MTLQRAQHAVGVALRVIVLQLAQQRDRHHAISAGALLRSGTISVSQTSMNGSARERQYRRGVCEGSVAALHAEIRSAGYSGGYSRVTDFIRAWREGKGQAISVNAFVPLAFEFGEAFQFDWSEEGLFVGDIY